MPFSTTKQHNIPLPAIQEQLTTSTWLEKINDKVT